MAKSYKNTKKGRSKVPKKPGAYNLKNKTGKTVYTGETNDTHRRIGEHHRDSKKHFAYATVTQTRTKAAANRIEDKRLSVKKPPQNKKKK